MQNKQQHLTPEQIARCADAINSDTYTHLPEFMRFHLLECNQCAAEVVNVAVMSSDMENVSIPELESKNARMYRFRKSANKKLLFGIAASVAIIAFALLITLPRDNALYDQNEIVSKQDIPAGDDSMTHYAVRTTNEPEEKAAVANAPHFPRDYVSDTNDMKESVSNKRENELLADYEPRPKLEKLYENMQGGYRGGSTEVITPPELYCNEEISLQWKNDSRQTLIVEIFDNKGVEIISNRTTCNNYKLPQLNPGLYYWKLIDKDFELLFVGKLIVRNE